MTDYEFLKQKHGFEEEGEVNWEMKYESNLIPDSEKAKIGKHQEYSEWFDEKGKWIGYL